MPLAAAAADDLAGEVARRAGDLMAAEEEIARRIVTMFGEMSKPVVAATRGDVRDLGFAFYMAADVRLASRQASFTTPDLSGGISPGWGLTHTLPRLIGPGRALDLLWSRRTVGAEEAYGMGLVDRLGTLRDAVEVDPRKAQDIPSTKGAL